LADELRRSARPRLLVFNSHPVQYFAPLYRRIHESGAADIMVLYGSRQNVDPGTTDAGFGRQVLWDVPLLEGYPHRFLWNVGGERGVDGLMSVVNPGVIREIVRGRYDAVLLHGHSHLTTLLALATAKLTRTAVLMRAETHLLLQHRDLKRVLRGPVMRAYYAMTDACLFLGTRNREFYRAHGVPEDRLFHVPYSVDNERFARQASEADTRKLREELGIAPEVPVVLFASKLMGRKRPHDLLQAYMRVRSEGIRGALVFVGDGEERASLEKAVREGQVPDVHFAGFRNQSELPAWYALASVFVLPSEGEPWGLVINEVMAAGTPVITTTEVGAAADLVLDDLTGFQYVAGDVDTLADRLSAVLSDSWLMERLSVGARARMREWGYEQCIEGIVTAITNHSGRFRRRLRKAG
jgi:glycosyltransferase involved in cell wall biosynthesis